MARAFNQISRELDSVYDPQRQVWNDQRAQLDPMMKGEMRGLDAAKTDAFTSIETGANRKGLYYSGIPIQEQAQYTGANYLPSVANLRAKYAQQKFNIQDAIAKITQDQYMKAQGIYQTELDRDAALSAARSGGGGGGGSYGYTGGTGGDGTGGGGGSGNTGGVKVNPGDQQLYNQMFINGTNGKWDDHSLVNDYNATLRSAQYGNQRDIKKIQFYHSFRPDLFGGFDPSRLKAPKAQPAQKSSNRPTTPFPSINGPMQAGLRLR